MNRTIAALAGLAMMFCFQPPGLAAPSGPTFAPGFHQKPRLPAGEHKAVATYVNSGNTPTHIGIVTWTTLDEATVKCPKKTCTLAMTAMQTPGMASTEGAPWGIVVLVDGSDVDGGPYQGVLPTTSYVTGNWQGQMAVAGGPHTITWQTVGGADYTMSQWADTATVLVP